MNFQQNNNFKLMIKHGIFLLTLLVSFNITFAQEPNKKNTTTLDMTSSYKPVLRNAVKINLAATQLNPDGAIPKMNYQVPAQNLFYSYQPISLKPLALQMDTNLYLGLKNYLKVGFGNFSTPYISAGFSFGNGKTSLLNLYADYISSKGKIKFQDYSQINIKGAGSYFTAKNEIYGSATISQNDVYLYGYNHDSFPNYKKDDVKNQYQNISIKGGIKNTTLGDYGISYNPTLEVKSFTAKNKLGESTLKITAPVEKRFGEIMSLKVEAKADITSYTTKNLISNLKISNNVFQLAPSLAYTSPQFNINAGVIPTWDNGNFVWLPNIYAEAHLQEKVFLIQAGWVGNYLKNTFSNLIETNPYLQTITQHKILKNLKYMEV